MFYYLLFLLTYPNCLFRGYFKGFLFDAFWTGKSPGAAVERFVLQHGDELRSDPTKYKHITDALASGKKLPKDIVNQWINDVKIAEVKRSN